MSEKSETILTSPYDQRVIVNVGGRRFETLESTLQRLPRSLLGDFHRRTAFFDTSRGEFFFDRSSDSFEAILNVYRTGGAVVVQPENVPLRIFLEDLHFYGLGEYAGPLESQHGLKADPAVDSTEGLRQKLWAALEPAPGSVPYLPALSTLLTIAIIVTRTILTLPALMDHVEDGLIVQTVFAVIILLELLARFLTSPNILQMLVDPLTWIDLIGSIVFFIGMGVKEAESSGGSFGYIFIRMARLAWVLRLWRLVRHTHSAALIRRALLKSTPALVVCFTIWLMGVLFFAPIFFWTEGEEMHGIIASVPDAVYFTVVTMTTIGYGDITPVTTAGKVFACLCAYFGWSMAILPIAIVVTNLHRLSEQNRA